MKESAENLTQEEELISVLMPTYNVVNYVEDAVKSILRQTYKNIELIIVDDCSTDGTYQLLEQMAAENSQIRLYRNETNSKICKTLNRALLNARGKYIGRMDGDDISEPKRFEILKKYLDEHQEVVLVGSNLSSIDESGKQFSRRKYPCSSQMIRRGNRFQPCVSHIWLARYEIYEVLSGYREVPFVEDYDFLLRGELKGYQYGNVDEYLYQCRIRSGNTGSTNGLKQRKAVEYIQRMHKNEEETHADCFDYDEYIQAITVDKKENERYIKAAKELTIAITQKKKPFKLIKHTISAMIGSKYIAKYVMSAVKFRILLLEDKLLFDK